MEKNLDEIKALFAQRTSGPRDLDDGELSKSPAGDSVLREELQREVDSLKAEARALPAGAAPFVGRSIYTLGELGIPSTPDGIFLRKGFDGVVEHHCRERIREGIARAVKGLTDGYDLRVCRLEHHAPHGADWVPVSPDALTCMLEGYFLPASE